MKRVSNRLRVGIGTFAGVAPLLVGCSGSESPEQASSIESSITCEATVPSEDWVTYREYKNIIWDMLGVEFADEEFADLLNTDVDRLEMSGIALPGYCPDGIPQEDAYSTVVRVGDLACTASSVMSDTPETAYDFEFVCIDPTEATV